MGDCSASHVWSQKYRWMVIGFDWQNWWYHQSMIGLPSGWSNSEVRLIQNADCFRWRERTSQSSGNFLGRPVGYCCKKKTLGQASQITAGREQHKAVQIKYQDQEHQTYFIIYFPINMDISVIFHQLYGYFPIFHQWDRSIFNGSSEVSIFTSKNGPTKSSSVLN